jgi:hypothetical protein
MLPATTAPAPPTLRRNWRDVTFNVAATIIGAGIVWRAGEAALTLVAKYEFGLKEWLAVGIVFIPAASWAAIAYRRVRLRRGDLLVDCGAPSGRLTALAGAAGGLAWASSPRHIFGDFAPIFALLIAGIILLGAFARVRIYAGGVWVYFGLFDWERIGSYKWSKTGRLILHGKRFERGEIAKLPIPVHCRDAVNRCLETYVARDSAPVISTAQSFASYPSVG